MMTDWLEILKTIGYGIIIFLSSAVGTYGFAIFMICYVSRATLRSTYRISSASAVRSYSRYIFLR